MLKPNNSSSINSTGKREKLVESLFYGFVFLMILAFILLQPFGEGPDEANRYKVTEFIRIHGILPIGSDPSISIYGYGASYAYQPILPYIIQGYLNRFLSLFISSDGFFLLSARLVNAFFGVLMAVFVRKSSKLLFERSESQWFFSLLICLMPQNLFLHSYVNTDSLALLSTSIIIYALLKGTKSRFDLSAAITLAFGISLCALSYYNAYGIILCSILYFPALFLKKTPETGYRMDFRSMFKLGGIISFIVICAIGWWFLRNYFLYDGDLFGMTARREDSIRTAQALYNPLSKQTYYNTGQSLFDLIRTPNFKMLTINSFIGIFGPMNLYMRVLSYRIYKILLLLGAVCFFIPFHSSGILSSVDRIKKNCFSIIMFLNLVIVTFLFFYYNYFWDYQPQGRYLHPMLISLIYFVASGYEKLFAFLTSPGSLPILNKKRPGFLTKIPTVLVVLVALVLIIILIDNIFYVLIPRYYGNGTLNLITYFRDKLSTIYPTGLEY